MHLAEQITTDIKTAMKAKDNATLSTLRMLLSAMKNKQIDLQHELSEDEVLAVVKSQVKQLKDSLVSFTEAGREDLAEGVKAEVEILEKYLPAEMTDEQITEIVKKTIEETGATSMADMGKVMGASMKAVAGQADGVRVKIIVQQLLAVFALVAIGLTVFPEAAMAAIPMVGEVATEPIARFEFALRTFRVLVLWGGIFSLIILLRGGFEYMTASMRDDLHLGAISKMTNGFIGTVVVAGLFSIATVFLNQMI